MKTPEQVFDDLQKQFGEYGDYVLLEQPYIENAGTNGGVAYFAQGATLELIKSLQNEEFCNEDGKPDACECHTLTWEILDGFDGDDESHACKWEKWDAYDHGEYLKSS